jgi:hypothetical protein
LIFNLIWCHNEISWNAVNQNVSAERERERAVLRFSFLLSGDQSRPTCPNPLIQVNWRPLWVVDCVSPLFQLIFFFSKVILQLRHFSLFFYFFSTFSYVNWIVKIVSLKKRQSTDRPAHWKFE